MIESINIKKVAAYDETGIQINDLKKVNFFFGSNGSGKSTIAKYLYDLSLEEDKKNLDYKDCTQNGYNHNEHQRLTFDENFTDINFKQNLVLKGVFSLNESNDKIDIQISTLEKLIKYFKVQSERKESLKTRVEADKVQKKSALLDYCWEQRNAFSTFTKINLEYPGSKPNHFQELNNVLQNPVVSTPKIEQLTESYNSLYENELYEISTTINSRLYKEIRNIERELNVLLSEVIVGNEDVDVAALIEKLNSRSWVETGVDFLNETEGTCPFCQKETIDAEIRNQFNELFDTSYKEKISTLEKLLSLYNDKANSFLSNISNIQDNYNSKNLVSNTYIKLQELFENNFEIVSYKIKHSNEKRRLVTLNILKPDLSMIINSINGNNATFLELDENKKILISNIWLYMAEHSKNNIEIYNNRETKYQRIIERANRFVESYNSKSHISKQTIEELRTKTVNTKDAVENINYILKNSGFEGFEIAEKDIVNNISQYYLKRNNNEDEKPVFRSLSEGEKNFISFLYFFQLCIGTDDIDNNSTKKKIIVIDDPVSSLDSQSLFVVSTLIHQLLLKKGNSPKTDKKLFKNVNLSQIFVLTHNLYFYKEVSLEQRPICTDYWHYRITKTNNISEISGGKKRTVFDDYSLLWKTLKDIKGNLPPDSTFNIVIANSMRRVIESFVNFVGLGNNSWGAVLNENSEEPSYYIKCSFISTINDESHKVSALDSIYYQKIIHEQPQLLFDVFKEIFISIGKDHDELMMEETLDN